MEMNNGNQITVSFVRGSNGMSFQISGSRFGNRVAGPKAWGNPYNRPLYEMTFPVKELYDALKENWPELFSESEAGAEDKNITNL